MSSKTKSTGAARPGSFPLFYKEPVALTADAHADWRLLAGDAAFAADEPAIALTPSEFALASKSYPIVFSTGDASPMALVGLEQANLFLDADGRWAAQAYAPAYVRRYPFVLFMAPDGSGGGLALDAASALVAKGGAAGEALFEGGAPTAVTLRALEFCRQYLADFELGRAFGKALQEEGLLTDRQVEAVLPSGRRLSVAGFKVVDADRFAQLPEEKIVAWHRTGWLALVHFHLASLLQMQDLLARQAERDRAKYPVEADGAAESARPGRNLQ